MIGRRTFIKKFTAELAAFAAYVALFSELPLPSQTAHASGIEPEFPEQNPEIVEENHFYVTCPIIMGHDLAVPQERTRFFNSIRRASDLGYNFATFDDLMFTLIAGQPLPVEKPCIVTMDDGYISQLEQIDIHVQYNTKATIFVIPGYQDSTQIYISPGKIIKTSSKLD